MAASAPDVSLQIVSENSVSERRISPSWTITHLRTRLEPITGVPIGSQRLSLKGASRPTQPIEAADEDSTQLAAWPLQAYTEIHVTDTRPPGMRANYTDVSAVDKYNMSTEDYEARTDSVLAWKKTQKLGRFDPNAPTIVEAKNNASFREAEERHIEKGARCRLLPESDHRRGTVEYVGVIPEIPGVGAWVGVALDEPTGKNDGSVKGQRYFQCGTNCGVIVRPERVEVGDFQPLDLDDELNDDDEEF